MDRFREKLATLRAEADAAHSKVEEANSLQKQLEGDLLKKDQEISSLQHRVEVLEGKLEETEERLQAAKSDQANGAAQVQESELLSRKLTTTEEKLEEVQLELKQYKEDLRQANVKAENFERRVQFLEDERGQFEEKIEEANAKYAQCKADLDETLRSIDEL